MADVTVLDVGALDEFVDGAARRIDVDGHRIAVVRIGDDLYAIGDRCTHADVSLAEGEVDADERTIECWKHGSAFSLETGEPLSLPAVRPDAGLRGAHRGRPRADRGRRMTHELVIEGLRAGVGGREILKGIDLVVRSGEVHAVMGPNGSGKSTLSHVLAGKPGYEVLGGTATLDGVDLLAMAAWERAQAGLFLASQYPVEVPGVSLRDVLRESLVAVGQSTDVLEAAIVDEAAAIGFERPLPRPAAQRRPLRRREEAQRDRCSSACSTPRSPCSTSSTPASTSTPCAP